MENLTKHYPDAWCKVEYEILILTTNVQYHEKEFELYKKYGYELAGGISINPYGVSLNDTQVFIPLKRIKPLVSDREQLAKDRDNLLRSLFEQGY